MHSSRGSHGSPSFAGAPTTITPVTRDPDDDYLFALARDARVDVIVSDDADLTDLDEPPTRVLSPRTFLNLLSAQR